MAVPTVRPTGVARPFREDEFIVSKTDLKGRITYANHVFLRVAMFEEHEILGQPHNIIRHPDMPACVFQFLWDELYAEREVFAYVINLARNGDHYWVFAHVTPSYDDAGNVVGYHSNRRVPHQDALEKVIPLYKALLEEEAKYERKKDAVAAGLNMLVSTLKSVGMPYDEFVFGLSKFTRLQQEAA